MSGLRKMLKVLARVCAAREMGLLAVLVIMFIVFSRSVDGFFDLSNILERSRYWVVPGMIAVAMTFIIGTAGIDLSVGSIVAMASVVLGLLYEGWGWPIALAALAAVLVALCAGFFNGAVSSYIRIPPLVVTLATMVLFRGLAMLIGRERAFSDFPDSFLALGLGDAFKLPVGEMSYFPTPLLALITVAALGWLLMKKSWLGRFSECIGENETAAEFAAINTRIIKTVIYAGCGLVCGCGALINTAIYSTAKANTAQGLELEVIACVVVGGTRISGGHASVPGTMLGLLIIGILRYGLVMAGMKSQHVLILVGCLVIITAIFNEWLANWSERRTLRNAARINQQEEL